MMAAETPDPQEQIAGFAGSIPASSMALRMSSADLSAPSAMIRSKGRLTLPGICPARTPGRRLGCFAQEARGRARIDDLPRSCAQGFRDVVQTGNHADQDVPRMWWGGAREFWLSACRPSAFQRGNPPSKRRTFLAP